MLVGRQEGHPPACKKLSAGEAICLEQGADLHMAQLMPLPLTVSCFSEIQIGFTFLVPAHPGSPRQRAVKRVCVRERVTEPGQGWARDPEQYTGADQRPRVVGPPAVNAGRGTGGDGGTALSSSAGHHRTLEPRGTHQHLLGCQVRHACTHVKR